MRRLIGVELTRLRWRRAVVVLLAAMVVLPVVIGVVTVLQKDAPGGEDAMVVAERLAAEELERCVADPEGYFGSTVPEEDVRQLCEEGIQPEFFLSYNRLDLEIEREEGAGFGVAVIVGLLAMLVGTTFVGHDWNTGSMGNQLLFVPRRLRVWLAKAVAVGAACLVAAALGVTIFWFVLAARFWSSGVDIPDGLLLDGLLQGWRGAGVAAAAGLGGYAITMLSRSTVFTLGLLFGVSVAGGILIGVLVDDPGWVDPTVNISAVIQDGSTYYVDVPESCYTTGDFDSSECDPERTRGLGDGLIYLGILGAVIVTGSTLSFRRRDVP